MGVNLGGGHMAMPQQRLNPANVRAVLQQMRSKRMAQRWHEAGLLMLAGNQIPCHRFRNRVRFDLPNVLSALKP